MLKKHLLSTQKAGVLKNGRLWRTSYPPLSSLPSRGRCHFSPSGACWGSVCADAYALVSGTFASSYSRQNSRKLSALSAFGYYSFVCCGCPCGYCDTTFSNGDYHYYQNFPLCPTYYPFACHLFYCFYCSHSLNYPCRFSCNLSVSTTSYCYCTLHIHNSTSNYCSYCHNLCYHHNEYCCDIDSSCCNCYNCCNCCSYCSYSCCCSFDSCCYSCSYCYFYCSCYCLYCSCCCFYCNCCSGGCNDLCSCYCICFFDFSPEISKHLSRRKCPLFAGVDLPCPFGQVSVFCHWWSSKFGRKNLPLSKLVFLLCDLHLVRPGFMDVHRCFLKVSRNGMLLNLHYRFPPFSLANSLLSFPISILLLWYSRLNPITHEFSRADPVLSHSAL